MNTIPELDYLDKIIKDSDKNLPPGTKGVSPGQSGKSMTDAERQQQLNVIEKSLLG